MAHFAKEVGAERTEEADREARAGSPSGGAEAKARTEKGSPEGRGPTSSSERAAYPTRRHGALPGATSAGDDGP